MHQSSIHQSTLAHAGFTLIEILVGIAIFLLLTGTAAFFIATFLASTDLNETSAQIVQTLRLARERSMAGFNPTGLPNTRHGVYFDSVNKRYILYQGASYATRPAPILDIVIDIPNSLTIATTFSGDANFSRFGNPTIHGTIILTHSIGDNRTIDINRFGIVFESIGPVGYWTFDGEDMTATTALDKSGNGNTGTLINGPQTAIGRIGQALEFDGVGDYVLLGKPSSLNNIVRKTVTAWIYPRSVGANSGVAIFDKQQGSIIGWTLYILSLPRCLHRLEPKSSIWVFHTPMLASG